MADKTPFGRPTKYSPEMLEKAVDYVKNYEEHDHVIPSIAGLAVVLGVCRKTIYSWADKEENADFLYTLGRIDTNQEFKLLNSGLSGDFNPTITKLALANHGYHEKPAEKELEDAPPVEINFHVKDAAAEIKVTNAKS